MLGLKGQERWIADAPGEILLLPRKPPALHLDRLMRISTIVLNNPVNVNLPAPVTPNERYVTTGQKKIYRVDLPDRFFPYPASRLNAALRKLPDRFSLTRQAPHGPDKPLPQCRNHAEFSFGKFLHEEDERHEPDAPGNRQPVIPSGVTLEIDEVVLDLQRHAPRRDHSPARGGDPVPQQRRRHVDDPEPRPHRPHAHVAVFGVKGIENRIEHPACLHDLSAHEERAADDVR